jgi:hypothetical protein
MFDQNKLLCFGANHITKHDKEKTQKPIMTENSSRRYLNIPLVEYMVCNNYKVSIQRKPFTKTLIYTSWMHSQFPSVCIWFSVCINMVHILGVIII